MTDPARTGASFSKAPETFRAREAMAKSQTLRLQSCFICVSLISTDVPFIQEVSGVYTSPFKVTNGLKMSQQTRKVSRAFEKRAPGPSNTSDQKHRRLWNYLAASPGNLYEVKSYKHELKAASIRKCSRCCKLVILLRVVMAWKLLLFWAWGIVPVVFSIVTSMSIKPFM